MAIKAIAAQVVIRSFLIATTLCLLVFVNSFLTFRPGAGKNFLSVWFRRMTAVFGRHGTV
jgi:hypothetical protein